jgi:hypothetical protein
LTYLDHVRLILEHCTGQWGLAAIIQRIRVCTVLDQEPDKRGMAMISRKHDLKRLAPSLEAEMRGQIRGMNGQMVRVVAGVKMNE